MVCGGVIGMLGIHVTTAGGDSFHRLAHPTPTNTNQPPPNTHSSHHTDPLGPRLLVVLQEHPVHKLRFAAQVDVVRPGAEAGGHHLWVLLVGS